jgi:mannose-6-phosphate isomerase-like protein (cupin superfamily)
VKRENIYRTTEWFKVLQTTPRTQTAVMKLGQKQATGRKPEAHEKSDQVILVVEGELSAEIGRKPLPNEGWQCNHYPPASKAQVHK